MSVQFLRMFLFRIFRKTFCIERQKTEETRISFHKNMFYEETDRPVRLSRAPLLRIAIMICTMGTVVFGFGVLADVLANAAADAATALFR